MAFVTLAAGDVDAKSPIDDALMRQIKDNEDDLNTRVVAAGSSPHLMILNGNLVDISTSGRSVAQAITTKEVLLTQFRAILKRSGTGGTLRMDIRKHTSPKTPITAISHQYNAATQSIAQTGSALNTQSIARFVAQISTQSITHAKAAKNINSIILLGTQTITGVETPNLVQYNLSATIDSDTLVGDPIVFASCTNANNDGTFTIVEKNRGGGNNVVVQNTAGVAQTGAAGTAQEKIMSYNFTNPVSTTGFVAGYRHDFASHTSALNDGDLLVYAINQAGNNVWVKNAAGVTQGGAAGTLDTNFWLFALTAPASATDYVVGEAAKTASHTSGVNDSGALEIIAVNSGSDNLVLYNPSGALQAGVAGTINTNRWTYAMPSDPSAQISAGHTVYFLGHTDPLNDGTFTVKQVNRSAANNLIIYNTAGVAQGGAVGNTYTTKKLIQFASDQSAVYTTASYIEMQGCVDSTYNYVYERAPFRVLEVNRGGGSNYNVVIDNPTGASQSSPSGYVPVEMKSVFNTPPSIASVVTGLEPDHNLTTSSTDIIATTIPANTPLALYITEFMTGAHYDLTTSIL